MLTDTWHRVTGAQPAPPLWVVLGCALVAAVAVLGRQLWPVARNVVTIAHEGGHALAAVATGRRLTRIRLHSDTSGVTVSVGRPTGPGMVLTMAAGYVAPSVLGLVAASLLALGRMTALLWLSLAFLAWMLVLVRNMYGVVSLVGTGAAVFAVSLLAPPEVQAGFAYLLAWFLLLAGPRPVWELMRKRSRGAAPYSDADQLARLTRVPGMVWVWFFGAFALAALLVGAVWLVP
jgi:hypothetical protein